MVKTNFVLIDYENVQPDLADALIGEHFKVLVFVGANQPKIDFQVVTAMQGLGSRAEYVKISGVGRNALDFHIAYYLGSLATSEPEAYFHVISGDKGFDPLLEHLRSKGLNAGRCADVRDIPIAKPASSASSDDKLSVILAYLIKRGEQRPGSVKTLTGSAASLFQPRLVEDEEVAALLQELRNNGVFVVVGTKVTYSLPD